MNKKIQITLIAMLLSVVTFGQTAKEIIQKMEDKARGNSLYAEMKITTVRPKWSREMTMKSWSKGEDYSLMVMTAPAKEKGIVYLKRKKEIWNWMPSIERSIKLPPSMMMQSWMGTDFTNDDLVRESSTVNDYDQKVIGNATISGRDCWKIELIPHEDAPVVWGKVIMWVDKKDYLQLKTQSFDEDMYLVNTMNASKIKSIGGRTIPTYMELIPEDKKGNMTKMEYLNMEFDKEISVDFFSIQNMKKIR